MQRGMMIDKAQDSLAGDNTNENTDNRCVCHSCG
jgi:hypothetical protein